MIGKNIRYLRRKNGLSQENIADAMDYKSYSTVQKWETETAEPNFKTAQKLADFFRVSLNDLAYTDLEEQDRINNPVYTFVSMKRKPEDPEAKDPEDPEAKDLPIRLTNIDDQLEAYKKLLSDLRKTFATLRVPIYSDEGTIIDHIELPKRDLQAGDYFAYRINGRSMSPELRDGDTVIARERYSAYLRRLKGVCPKVCVNL